MKYKNNSLKNNIYRKLKRCRIVLGISQHELASAIGISIQQIQKYENLSS